MKIETDTFYIYALLNILEVKPCLQNHTYDLVFISANSRTRCSASLSFPNNLIESQIQCILEFVNMYNTVMIRLISFVVTAVTSISYAYLFISH